MMRRVTLLTCANVGGTLHANELVPAVDSAGDLIDGDVKITPNAQRRLRELLDIPDITADERAVLKAERELEAAYSDGVVGSYIVRRGHAGFQWLVWEDGSFRQPEAADAWFATLAEAAESGLLPSWDVCRQYVAELS